MSPGMSDILQAQVEEQSKADAEQSAYTRALAEKTAGAQQAIMDKLIGRRTATEYPPEVLNIANALVRQPALIPAVDTFLKKLVASVNDAVNKAIADAMPKP